MFLLLSFDLRRLFIAYFFCLFVGMAHMPLSQGTDFKMGFGGKGANQAVAAASAPVHELPNSANIFLAQSLVQR